MKGHAAEKAAALEGLRFVALNEPILGALFRIAGVWLLLPAVLPRASRGELCIEEVQKATDEMHEAFNFELSSPLGGGQEIRTRGIFLCTKASCSHGAASACNLHSKESRISAQVCQRTQNPDAHEM